ncbi:MAG: bifunctional phosphopantothenoylcysteine decarboxylase/phosphopantothenate--cysteine ligase CoaBC, partial [Methylophilaceae bacterium]
MQSIRQLVLGISGGIAAYKAAELTRLFIKRGIAVQVVMTEAAQQFITPVTMQALSGKPVLHSMWDSSIANGMPHIELSRQAQLILVAPASADFIAKLAYGMADDLLSTLCLARDCPLVIAPAMNKQMWEHPATQRNIRQLAQDGVLILGPDCGEQACGEHGQGRMLEPEQIVEGLLQLADLNGNLLQGKRLLITAGPTQEAIDPVRVITNLSSGKMGYALAETATLLGAEVT